MALLHHFTDIDRGILHRSARASVVVGSLLTALNHGDALLSGSVSSSLWWKVPLTYVVPFVVATYGALGARPSAKSAPCPHQDPS